MNQPNYIAVRQGIGGDFFHLSSCWPEQEAYWWKVRQTRASAGAYFCAKARELRKKICPICKKGFPPKIITLPHLFR